MRSVHLPDSELLNGLIHQDERILKEYYYSFFQSIRRFVLSNNGNDEDARDLFQDVLLVLFQKARDGQFKLTCSMGTYLYSIARFLWLKELSKRKWISYQSVEHEEFVDADADIDTVSEKNERLMFFRKCFEKLSENCRKILTLFTEGLSIAEITGIMGFKNDQHTKNRRYRCKLSLIKYIKNEYDYNTVSYGNNTHHRTVP
jgi:RNA polymerase sigma factor (sigma-70 family)